MGDHTRRARFYDLTPVAKSQPGDASSGSDINNVPAPAPATPQFILCLLPNSDVCDFDGDVLVTSANRHLEGARLRNWWGFAGRKSADAALHEHFGGTTLSTIARKALLRKREAAQASPPYLAGWSGNPVMPHDERVAALDTSTSESAPSATATCSPSSSTFELEVGEVLPTTCPRPPDAAGSGSGSDVLRRGTSSAAASSRGYPTFILHVLLPLYRPLVADAMANEDSHTRTTVETRDISHVYAPHEIATNEATARDALRKVVRRSLEWTVNGTKKRFLKIAYPALGCGCRCYPVKAAAGEFVQACFDFYAGSGGGGRVASTSQHSLASSSSMINAKSVLSAGRRSAGRTVEKALTALIDDRVLIVEVRFYDDSVFLQWVEVVTALCLREISQQTYWEVYELGSHYEQKRKDATSCAIASRLARKQASALGWPSARILNRTTARST